jgi:SapC
MEIETLRNEPQLSGQVLLYSRPEPLNPERHASLGLSPVDQPFNFVRPAHAIPLTVTEFGPACLCFPIIFTGSDFQPLAIMSVRQNENLFINDQGFFEFGTYVPAYIRRYPFVLANDPSSGQLLVCIERDAEAVQENGQVALFEGGQPTPFTQQAIDFCSNFESERQRTMSFVELLRGHDLLELREQIFTPQNADGSQGEPQKLADFYAVSEAKLAALPADKLAELRDNGALQQIYNHLNSLLNWDKLVSKTMQKDAGAPKAANN